MSMYSEQLRFTALLDTAAQDNKARSFAKEAAHLPSDWCEARALHPIQIRNHHAAMMENDFDTALRIRADAHLLAKKLNGGQPGILAGRDAPGCVLARAAAAPRGSEPLWGQDGRFMARAAGTTLDVEAKGMFGIGAIAMPYIGFSVRAVDPTTPFISETGYRSFLGVSVAPQPGITTGDFVQEVIETYIAQELKGKLLRIKTDSLAGATWNRP
ncbi:hypothetical protein [Litoreibacter roseus]|uniref:Uncharacterized protein n=1 Tax=Litoreibacter roseus TaxID=2601869 RepID=A0A6N6JJE7_9RHOB|nr:hypothetical protein [Litoreibacter roseus]GFE65559.1 hypothetical protein KIN_26330 [Litoreibacter roseus]